MTDDKKPCHEPPAVYCDKCDPDHIWDRGRKDEVDDRS